MANVEVNYVTADGARRKAVYRRPTIDELAAFMKMGESDQVKALEYYHNALCVEGAAEASEDALTLVSVVGEAVQRMQKGNAKILNDTGN